MELLYRRVRVREEQPTRYGPPKYPNRTGRVVKQNDFETSHNGLFYIELDATKQAKAREELFLGDELEILD